MINISRHRPIPSVDDDIEYLKEENAGLAFKGFNKGFKCKGYKFKVGQAHSITNKKKIEACENGFHACRLPSGVDNFYSIHCETHVFALVLQWGKLDNNNGWLGPKCASKHIKIVKIITRKKMERLTEVERYMRLASCPEDHMLRILHDLC